MPDTNIFSIIDDFRGFDAELSLPRLAGVPELSIFNFQHDENFFPQYEKNYLEISFIFLKI